MIKSKWIKLKIENYISKVHKKETGEAGGRVRVLYLLLTNEPSNYKEWAGGGEAKRGPGRAGRGVGVEGGEYGLGKGGGS